MKVLPLVIHAGMILPRHTALFSDALAVASIVVTEGDDVVLTTQAPHGLAVGDAMAVGITAADTPNAITVATVDDDDNIVLTTEHPHSLTTTPNPALFDAYSQIAKLAGFTSSSINGNRQIVDVPDRYTVVVKPGSTLASVTLNGNERLLEQLEQEIVGWHKVVATGASTLAFPTPAVVNRTYAVENPLIVRDVRVFGALNYEMALAQYTADDSETLLTRPVMFILPQAVDVRGSQDMVEGAFSRTMVDDGFSVLVFIPGHSTAAHVEASDLAHGAIYRAVLRTFHGLKIARSEYCDPGQYQAQLRTHSGTVGGNAAIYAHEYTFNMPAELRGGDGISPFEWSQIDDGALADGDVPDSIYPSDPPPFRDLDVTGILRHGYPSPLTGTFPVDVEAIP